MDPLGFLGSLVSGIFGMAGANKTAQAQGQIAGQSIQSQKDYAQNRIQWTVADAKAAGINPLAALGNATQSFSNVVGATDSGAGMQSMGQNLGRALQALSSKDDEKEKLENDLTRAKIANVNADTVRQSAEASRQATRVVAAPKPIGPKPLFEQYVDEAGGIHTLPSKDASSAMQNWASLPAQIPIAISQAGHGLSSEYHKLMDPIYSHVREMEKGFVSPAETKRRLNPSSSDWYYSPF